MEFFGWALTLLALVGVLLGTSPGEAAITYQVIEPVFRGSPVPVLSGDGQTAAGSLTGNPEQAIRWTESGGIVALPNAGFVRSQARAISPDGSIVVGNVVDSIGAGKSQAIRWIGNSATLLPQLSPESSTFATDASSDGSVIVGVAYLSWFNGTSPQAFRWTSAGGTKLLGNMAGKTMTLSPVISGDGQVIAGVGSTSASYSIPGPADTFEAFRWTAGTGFVDLGNPSGALGVLEVEISLDGSTIAGRALYDPGDFKAARWRQDGGWELLGGLPDRAQSNVNGISADGNTIVGRAFRRTYPTGNVPFDDLFTAYVWDSVNGMRSVESILTAHGIDLAGASLQESYDVSSDGRTILGAGRTATGASMIWKATIPEVGVLSMLMEGLVVGGVICWRANWLRR